MLKGFASKRVTIIGYGIVGQPFAYMLLKKTNLKPKNLTIIDMKPEKELGSKLPEGCKFINVEIVKENYEKILKGTKPDFIVDLSVYVNTLDLIRFCTKNNIHLITTSVEPWEHAGMDSKTSIADDMVKINQLKNELNSKKGMIDMHPTIVINSGANPGYVSLFARLGLMKFGTGNTMLERAKSIELETIHISEIDTQRELKKNTKAFRNTWSIDGIFEEGSAHSELGLGTHEEKLPKGYMIKDTGLCKMALLKERGVDVKVKSWVPDIDNLKKDSAGTKEIVGHVIQHGESGSICAGLTDKDYSPSVYYAYDYSEPLKESIEKFGIEGASDLKIENKPIDHRNGRGYDELGTLFICKNLDMFWTGSILSTEDTKKMFESYVPAGPTSTQVIACILGSMALCNIYPELGIFGSVDEIPEKYDEILWKVGKPLLGKVISVKLDKKADSTQFHKLLISKTKI